MVQLLNFASQLVFATNRIISLAPKFLIVEHRIHISATPTTGPFVFINWFIDLILNAGCPQRREITRWASGWHWNSSQRFFVVHLVRINVLQVNSKQPLLHQHFRSDFYSSFSQNETTKTTNMLADWYSIFIRSSSCSILVLASRSWRRSLKVNQQALEGALYSACSCCSWWDNCICCCSCRCCFSASSSCSRKSSASRAFAVN